MTILIVSQNLKHYNMQFSVGTIFRVNLAWIDNLHELETITRELDGEILIDIPSGRIKPPNNSYTLEELIPCVLSNQNIKYLAVSNIERGDQLQPYLQLSDRLVIIPKIETKKGIDNIDEIVRALDGNGRRIIMLDHDDLFASLMRAHDHPGEFTRCVDRVVSYCAENGITLLRARGIVFSD